MPQFACIRKCYVEDRLYKPGDVFEGEKAPTRSFEGYIEKGKEPAKAQAQASLPQGQGGKK